VFCGWWGARFAEDVVVIGDGVFVEFRFGLSLNGVLDRIQICRLPEDRIFDNSGGGGGRPFIVRIPPMFSTGSMRFHCEGPTKGAHGVGYI